MSGQSANSGTKVWIKESAIDAVRNPRLSFKEKIQRSGSFRRQGSFTTSSVASYSSNRDFSDNDSEIGSIGAPPPSSGRDEKWGWKQGWMMESTKGNVVVRVDEVIPANSLVPGGPVTLPASALKDGDVVMANEYPMSKDGRPICPDDLISLTHLHEPSVVECLQNRYMEDVIYTATGPVLLALNPFQTLRGVYGETSMKRYWDKAEKNGKEELPPHVYAIADNSFRSMMRKLDQTIGQQGGSDCDQSILVSGESGAGKTVTTKFVMKYLAALSQRAGNVVPEKRAYVKVAEKKMNTNAPKGSSSLTPWGSSSSYTGGVWNGHGGKGSNVDIDDHRDGGLAAVTSLGGSSSNSIEAQVLQSNPILESFGNARTMRNDNSSRFGKFIEIHFTRSGRLVGAQIETYLLEKVRLVTQSSGERNYHVFFELLSGAVDANELRKFFIASTATPDDFRMTANGTNDRRDGVSDKETFRALRTALNTMKFAPDEQSEVFAVAAAILHASNLTFRDLDQESELDARNIHLEPVCHLLGVSAEDLNQALCHFSITAGKDTHVQRSLTVDRAEKGLEALLKATYGALFAYLVSRINDSIAYKPVMYNEEGEEIPLDPALAPAACIGVLDIFGFETFAVNSFEQLCINYCNEALQQQFNAFVLKNEQKEYEREGIEWSFIEFPENQDVLDLIEKRGSGILCILDDQCRAPGTSDKSFALDVYNKCRDKSRFSANRKQTAVLQFAVHHYAGPVEYNSVGFIEKNRDELPKETTDLLLNSVNPFIQYLAEIIDNNDIDQANSTTGTEISSYKLRRQESSVARTTVGGHFRRQLRHLRDKIDRMSPHYIRCLKPNDHLIPDHFDQAAVAEQLRCGGILEAVRVARAGFSNHYPHIDFLRRYRCLGWKELRPKQSGSGSTSSSPYVGNPAFRRDSSPARKKWGTPSTGFRGHGIGQTHPSNQLESSSDGSVQTLCKDLIKILYRKLQTLEKEESKLDAEINCNTETSAPVVQQAAPPAARAKNFSFKSASAAPSWSKSPTRASVGSGLPLAPSSTHSKARRYSAWDQKSTDSRPPASPCPSSQNTRGSPRHGPGTSDWAKVGIQMGKTKVFLRHKSFEALERLRSQAQAAAATKLNAIFRMYLARMAYVEVRDTVRYGMHNLAAYENECKETKEQEYEDDSSHFYKARESYSSYCGEQPSLVEQFALQVRASIHNPVPRHEWGKETPSRPFKWSLVEGLWVKNHDI